MYYFSDLELVRSINDPIHGTIKLSNDEMKIIQHPLFKRLHNLRQNSFLYKVFPSAKHTRFEHSIGVMHCAHKLLSAVIENGTTANQDIANKGQFEEHKNVGVGVALAEHLKPDQKIKIFTHLRIAALLHDIGHGPLSHLFDSYAPSIEEFEEILDSDKILENDSEYRTQFSKMLSEYKKVKIEKGVKDIRIEHEHVSSYFTYKILSELKFEREDIYSILTILKPELELNSIKVKIFENEYGISKLLTDIVASAPIDCDRMDYLKRDSFFAGVPYGNYSEDRILKTVLSYAHNDEIRMGLKISGLHAIEGFLLSRYQMFVQVYGHKTNEACNAMLEHIGSEKLPFNEWSGKELTSEDFISLYNELSDDNFLFILSEKLKSNGLKDKDKTILNLKDRDLWKRVYEVEEYVPSKDHQTNVNTTFKQCFEKMREHFDNVAIYIGDRFPLKDIASVGAKLLTKNEHSYYTVTNKELNNSSQIIKSLNQGLRIHRIYALDKSNVSDCKDYARTNIHALIMEAEVADADAK